MAVRVRQAERVFQKTKKATSIVTTCQSARVQHVERRCEATRYPRANNGQKRHAS